MGNVGPRLVAENGPSFAIAEGSSVVGRPDQAAGWTPTIDLSMLDRNRKTSRRHAEIKRTGSTLLVRDLGGANRTLVNGQPLEPNKDYPLSEGDVITFGEAWLRVEGLGGGQPALRCPKCDEPVTADMAICASCGANLFGGTLSIEVGPSGACFRCGRATRGEEYCADCAEAIAAADRELLALSGLKRKK